MVHSQRRGTAIAILYSERLYYCYPTIRGILLTTTPKDLARGALLALLAILFLPDGLGAANEEETAAKSDRAKAYYHYALAHLNMERAGQYGRREYWDKALEEYKAAIAADPDSEFLRIELIRFYGRTDRLDQAVAEAESALAKNPDSIEVRRTLGRFLAAYATNGRRAGVDRDLLDRAVNQHEKILEIEPNDTDSLLKLSGFYQALEQPDKAEGVLKRLLEIDPDSAEGLANLARLYLSQGKTEEAVEALEKVRDSGEAGPQDLATLADLYERMGRNSEAADLYERVREMGASNAALSASLARNWALSGEYERALNEYKALSREEPNNPEYQLRLSQLYRQKRRFKDAWKHLDQAAELAPDSMEVKYNTVLLYEAEGKTPRAIEELVTLLEQTRKDGYTQREKRNRGLFLEQLGMLYRDEGNVQRAVDTFRELGQVDPDAKPRVISYLVDTYRFHRDYESAMRVADEGSEEFPENRSLIMQRSGLLAETGDWREGSRLLKEILRSEPDNRRALLALAHVYEKGKRYDDAIATVEKAAGLAETDEQRLSTLFTFGAVLERAKRYDEAEKKFRELLDKDPDNSSALNYLGYMLADINKMLDEAHDMIQRALDLDPENGAYLDSLGWVYYRQKKFDLAERYLVRSLEKVKRDPIVHSHLGDVYFEQGKVEQARKHWELSIEEWNSGPAADRDPKEIAKLEGKLSKIGVKLSSRAQDKDQ